MVADRHPLVVGQQRVVGPEQLADRGGVVDAGVEVGVVADAAGQRSSRPRPAARRHSSRKGALRRCRRPAPSDSAARRRRARPRAQRHEARSGRRRPAAPAAASTPSAQGHCAAASCRSSTWSPMATPMRQGSSLPARRKRPKGRFWIGKSVSGVVGRVDPALQRRVVGGVGQWSCVLKLVAAGRPSTQRSAASSAPPRSAHAVGRKRQRLSNMKASVSSSLCGASVGVRRPCRRPRRRGRAAPCSCAGWRRRAGSPRAWRRTGRTPGP